MEFGKLMVCEPGGYMKFRLPIIVILSIWLAACEGLTGYASGDQQEGVVVDTETGEPVADAFVIGSWVGDGFQTTICFHSAMARTDASGKYLIPAWREKNEFGASNNQRVYVGAYKEGYYHSYLRANEKQIRLARVDLGPENIEQRIAVLREAARQFFCDSAGESSSNVAAFHEALYEEAQAYSNGVISEDVLYLRELVERHRIGFDAANRRFREDVRILNGKVGYGQTPSVTNIETTDDVAAGRE